MLVYKLLRSYPGFPPEDVGNYAVLNSMGNGYFFRHADPDLDISNVHEERMLPYPHYWEPFSASKVVGYMYKGHEVVSNGLFFKFKELNEHGDYMRWMTQEATIYKVQVQVSGNIHTVGDEYRHPSFGIGRPIIKFETDKGNVIPIFADNFPTEIKVDLSLIDGYINKLIL